MGKQYADMVIAERLFPFMDILMIMEYKSMLNDQLKALKNQKNLTAQEIADRSGIPVSTINKILSGQTDSPSFRAICDIIKVMGGSVDEMIGITHASPPQGQLTADVLEQLLRPYKEALDTKNKWILRLFIFSCTMVAALLLVLIVDFLRPAAGWIR